MAENEGDSKFLKGLFVGFLLGVLIALGMGGSLAYLSVRQERQRADQALREVERKEELARKSAEEALEQTTTFQRLLLDAQNRAEAAELEKRALSDMLKDAKQQDKGAAMPEPTPAAPLIEPDFLARLEQLELVSRKIFLGRMKGERRSKRKGQSVEFADYRNYVVGDDLRFLDWNLYARLDKLFLRLFMEEEDLHFYILLD